MKKAFLYSLILLFFYSCSDSGQEEAERIKRFISARSLFVDQITSFTSGVIGSQAKIKIKLTTSLEGVKAGDPIETSLFSFDPSIDGATYWEDNRTVVFQPTKPLPNGQQYLATFKVAELIKDAGDKGDFKFAFKCIPQNYESSLLGMSVYDAKDLTKVKINGTFQTADAANTTELEKVVQATQNGQVLKITWDHSHGSNQHLFTIEGVKRGESEGKVSVKWNGSAIKVDRSFDESFVIPSLSDFKAMQVNIVRGKENYISVLFSDPLMEKQNLSGFIQIATTEPRYVINLNELKIYPTAELDGEAKLTIFKGIKNSAGFTLKEDFESILRLTQSKPELKITANSGAIIPNSQGLIIPFEAVGLKAVDVTIVKIFENNVLQHLQVNNIDGQYELRRVGRPIAKKTIDLIGAGVTDLNQWNRYTLDLAEIISVEPAAIYEIRLSFKKSQSMFFCANDENEADQAEEVNWQAEEEASNWDNYEDYYSYEDYDWYQRENPCHSTYYLQDRSVSKMVFASDIGLMAKRGDQGDLQAIATNMLTTEPMSDVSFSVYDYQQQVIGSGVSDSKGMAKIKISGQPFVLVAKSKKQFGYLKLDDGSSLSLSNFNISGQVVQKGIKGYIYGERGVWRPGDDIHLTFILEDKQKVLPASYPVVCELTNPEGQLVKKTVKTESVNSMFKFTMNTGEDAPTGMWTVKVKAGGVDFTKSLKIETVKPNRLKIKLDFHKEKLTALDGTVSGDLDVKWLHGAVAKNLKADFGVLVVPITTKFEKYPSHTFDDESKYYSAEEQSVFSGRLDQNGHANVNVSLEVNDNPPGALMAIFTGKVFEEGGDFSIDKVSIPFYPYISFVGIKAPEGDRRGMLLTDKDHSINIVSVDAKGVPVSRDDMSVELYKLNWKWWWDNSGSDISNYVGSTYNEPIQRGTIDTKNGIGEWKLNIKYPDWGRYYIKVTDPVSGHSSGKVVYVDWPGWAGKAKKGDMGGVSMLDFEVEKAEYKVGEKIKISFPSSKGSRVLVSLETGKTILQSLWVETEDKSTTVQFDAVPDMAPNVYANITLIQPHAQTANDLPIRMYGIQSIKVVDPKTVLKPILTIPAELRPAEKFKVEVKEETGRAMTYTIAMVDEGLLDLTKFKTPSPWDVFYAREALGIKTWDVYDDVIGAYGGKIERLLAIGGDGELNPAESKKANRFKPVVKYIGPFYLEAGKKATHEIEMPQYIGSVRTMLVAAQEGAYGSTEVTTPVKQPVMVLATLPRVAGPGEEMDLPVTIFVADAKIKTVNIFVVTEGKLQIVGQKSTVATFKEAGEQVEYFRVKASDALGFAKVSVTATAGSTKANYDIEMNVRASNPEMVDVQDKLIVGNETWNSNYVPLGMLGTNTAIIEVSSLPSLNLEQRLRYLIAYPHGCIEQTTSSVFAQLYLEELTNVNEETKQRISANINAAITHIQKFQTSNGGFAYWPGETEENDWGTNYAGHFLIEAKKKGYAVPEVMMSNWIKYQTRQANQWSKGGRTRNDLVQSYRLYGLALAGEKALGAMNRMKDMEELSNVAKWRLALAYAVAGYKAPAEKIISGLSKEVSDYNEMSYTYGSSVRDHAMILETLTYLEKPEEAYPILEKIALKLGNKDQWMSTQETAFCLIGVSSYTKGVVGNEELSFNVNVGSEVAKFEKGKYVTQIMIDKSDKETPLVVTNKGKTPIYVRLIRKGIPLEGHEVAGSKNINMQLIYLDDKGNQIDASQIKQTQDFTVKVTVHNPGILGDYEELALTQIFPSGWEIINTRLDGTDQYSTSDKADYLDIRDDRVMTYFDLKANERKSFSIKLNASYKGKFYLPAVALEAMYDNNIYSRTTGKWIEVK